METVAITWILVLLAACAYCEGTTDQQRSEAEENGRKMTASLYNLLRGIAFPQSPALDAKAANVDNRFILLMPGKVLNYFDYYPGREYTRFIQVGQVDLVVKLAIAINNCEIVSFHTTAHRLYRCIVAIIL